MFPTIRTICYDKFACRDALSTLKESILLANDIETIPYEKKKRNIHNITVDSWSGLIDNRIYSFVFPFQNSKSQLSGVPNDIEDIYYTCRELGLTEIPKTYQNGVYDHAWKLYYRMPVTNYAFDTMSMWWSRYPDLPRRLDFISSVLLDHYQYWKGDRKQDDWVTYLNYAMGDTEYTLCNTLKLIEMMNDNEQMRINFFHAHMRCIAGLHMSALGIAVDESVMNEIHEALNVTAIKALQDLRDLVADQGFNPNSVPQKKELFYGILGARPRNAKGRFVRTIDEGSTGKIPLRSMRAEHPILRRVADSVLGATEPAKQISNVIGIARFPAGSTGSRFLTSYDGVGTTTSRLASRSSAFGHGGNAQNVRKKYRRFAVADKGCFLLEVDFSAADDVFVAFESREQKKIDLVRSGRDTHATNALIFFPNWTYEGIVEGKSADDPKVVHPITGIRQITKKVVHGCHYLMAAMTLFNSAGREAIVAAAIESGNGSAGRWAQDALVIFCDELDSKFRTHYPRFKRIGESPDSWYLELRNEVVRTGGFTTPFRYFQSFISDPYDDSTLRAVAATAGQAGTAGRINMVMEELIFGYIPRFLRDGQNPNWGDDPHIVSAEQNGCSIRLQTHDSITFNIDPRHRNWHAGVENIFHSFRRPIIIHGETVRVGIEADASLSWGGKGVGVKKADDLIPWLEDLRLI